MRKYWVIGKENLRHNMSFTLIAVAVMMLVSPLVLGMKNLDAVQSAKVLEMYAALAGIILFPPLFLPEQNQDLRELVMSKYTSQAIVCIVRLVQAMAVLVVVILFFIGMMKSGGSVFPAGKDFLGTLAGAAALGGLGILMYGLSDNPVIGYMAPLIYYLINYGAGEKYLKNFYLFSMMKGSYTEKIYLGVAAVLMTAAGIYWRTVRRR